MNELNITKSLLTKLIRIPSVSGYERFAGMTSFIENYFKNIGFSPCTLPNGTVLNTGKKNRILVTAHCDEIGFMVTKSINGKTYVQPLGGSSPANLVNTKVFGIDFLSRKKLYGELTWKGNDSTISNPWDFVEVKLPPTAAILSPLTFSKKITWRETVINAPGLDNKSGLAALLMFAKLVKEQNLPVTIAAVTQEETSSWGIVSLINSIQPELIIDIDAAYGANNQIDEAKSIPVIGNGAALQVYGKRLNPEREFISRITKILEDSSIPLQYEIPRPETGGTILSSAVTNFNSYFLQVNVPVMDQHTAESTADCKDIASAITILRAVCTNFTGKNLFY